MRICFVNCSAFDLVITTFVNLPNAEKRYVWKDIWLSFVWWLQLAVIKGHANKERFFTIAWVVEGSNRNFMLKRVIYDKSCSCSKCSSVINLVIHTHAFILKMDLRINIVPIRKSPIFEKKNASTLSSDDSE